MTIADISTQVSLQQVIHVRIGTELIPGMLQELKDLPFQLSGERQQRVLTWMLTDRLGYSPDFWEEVVSRSAYASQLVQTSAPGRIGQMELSEHISAMLNNTPVSSGTKPQHLPQPSAAPAPAPASAAPRIRTATTPKPQTVPEQTAPGATATEHQPAEAAPQAPLSTLEQTLMPGWLKKPVLQRITPSINTRTEACSWTNDDPRWGTLMHNGQPLSSYVSSSVNFAVRHNRMIRAHLLIRAMQIDPGAPELGNLTEKDVMESLNDGSLEINEEQARAILRAVVVRFIRQGGENRNDLLNETEQLLNRQKTAAGDLYIRLQQFVILAKHERTLPPAKRRAVHQEWIDAGLSERMLRELQELKPNSMTAFINHETATPSSEQLSVAAAVLNFGQSRGSSSPKKIVRASPPSAQMRSTSSSVKPEIKPEIKPAPATVTAPQAPQAQAPQAQAPATPTKQLSPAPEATVTTAPQPEVDLKITQLRQLTGPLSSKRSETDHQLQELLGSVPDGLWSGEAEPSDDLITALEIIHEEFKLAEEAAREERERQRAERIRSKAKRKPSSPEIITMAAEYVRRSGAEVPNRVGLRRHSISNVASALDLPQTMLRDALHKHREDADAPYSISDTHMYVHS